MINELYSMKSISEKASLIQSGVYKIPENLDEINLTGLELFNVIFSFKTVQIFKKYDRNSNGFLEIYEYIACLKESDVKLSEAEIITLGL